MDERIDLLYKLPDISQYEDVCLLTLRESCAVLENQIHDILLNLSPDDRQVLEAYIDLRNELEFETVKTALRWGKRHYK